MLGALSPSFLKLPSEIAKDKKMHLINWRNIGKTLEKHWKNIGETLEKHCETRKCLTISIFTFIQLLNVSELFHQQVDRYWIVKKPQTLCQHEEPFFLALRLQLLSSNDAPTYISNEWIADNISWVISFKSPKIGGEKITTERSFFIVHQGNQQNSCFECKINWTRTALLKKCASKMFSHFCQAKYT